MDYCSVVWGTSPSIDKLLKLQKRAARLILDKPFDTPSHTMFATLGWLPIKDRIKWRTGIMAYQVVNKMTPDYLNVFKYVNEIHSRVTRQSISNKLYVPKPRIEISKQSFTYRGAVIFNEIPDNIKNTSYHNLKNLYYTHLLPAEAPGS